MIALMRAALAVSAMLTIGPGVAMAQQAGSGTTAAGRAVSEGQPVAAATPDTMPQLCRLREQQIVGLVRTIAARSRAAAPTVPAQRDALGQQLRGLMANERDLELSWNRLECARILYGAR